MFSLYSTRAAINLAPKVASFYFDRVYALLVLEKIEESCQDWQMSRELGNEEAVEMINKYCH